MSWANDGHGFVFRPHEVKLFKSDSHTWAMKLSHLDRQPDKILRIMTYSLPDMPYCIKILSRHPINTLIICHAKFIQRAIEIKSAFPEIRIATNDKVHSKMVLIEPETVYVGSANFGDSGWHEVNVGIRSKDAHDYYAHESFDCVWRDSIEIPS